MSDISAKDCQDMLKLNELKEADLEWESIVSKIRDTAKNGKRELNFYYRICMENWTRLEKRGFRLSKGINANTIVSW